MELANMVATRGLQSDMARRTGLGSRLNSPSTAGMRSNSIPIRIPIVDVGQQRKWYLPEIPQNTGKVYDNYQSIPA
jgi:hypothetical protein